MRVATEMKRVIVPKTHIALCSRKVVGGCDLKAAMNSVENCTLPHNDVVNHVSDVGRRRRACGFIACIPGERVSLLPVT